MADYSNVRDDAMRIDTVREKIVTGTEIIVNSNDKDRYWYRIE